MQFRTRPLAFTASITLIAMLMGGAVPAANALEPVAAPNAELATEAETPGGSETSAEAEPTTDEAGGSDSRDEQSTGASEQASTAEPELDEKTSSQEAAVLAEIAPAQSLVNRIAPASAAQLAPGKYTVTANPYVAGSDAPIGVNVYMSDPGFPPVAPQRLNTTLEVAADGTLKVLVPFNQEIFTLQAIADGADVQVAEIERGGSIAWGGTTPNPAYPDRIVMVTAILGNHSGEYTFGEVTQYPVPLQVEKHWPVHLSVDFASAVRQIAGDFSQSYHDAATGVDVKIEAEEGNPLIPELPEAVLRVQSNSPNHTAIEAALSREFVAQPNFSSWQIAMTGAKGELPVTGDVQATISVPSKVAEPLVFVMLGGTATLLSGATAKNGTVTFAADRLGDFAIVDAAVAARWAHTKVFSGEPGTTMTYRTTGEADYEFPGLDFPSLDSLGAYSSFLGEESSAQRMSEAKKLVADDFADPALQLFTFGLDLSFENIPGATVSKHQSWRAPLGGGRTSLTGSVPVKSEADRVFLIRGAAGSGLSEAVELSVEAQGANASFDIVHKDTPADDPAAMVQMSLWNAATGKDTEIDIEQTAETEIAYIAVVREAATAIERPAAAVGFVYNGQEQIGVPANDGYELSVRPRATAVGNYLAQATLKPGYIWADGGNETVQLTWEIAPATLTASYSGERVAADGTPQLAVTLSGFVAGENAANIDGFVAPTVAPPAILTPGASYELKPSGGKATNYRFEYVSGTLSVEEQLDPNALKPGSYRITSNLFVPAHKNDILGLTAYMTNPKNPLVSPNDPNYGVPTSPVSDNARLVVSDKGKRTLVLDVPNPAFTLMKLGTPSSGAKLLGVARDGKSYGSHSGGRITQLVVQLESTETEHMFSASSVYAAPLQLDKTWDLHLAIDYANARWESNDTTVTVPGGEPGVTPVQPGVKPKPVQPGTRPDAPEKLAAGVYNVSANFWFDRSVTGLPLNPHLTNASFPPKDPVSGNAKLVVAEDGTGRVTVPIVIQDRILSVRSISGGGIVQTSGGGSVSSVTVDLGFIDPAASAINRTMTAAVRIGDLAYSIGGPIFGGTRDHTWPASFEVTFSGVPGSGGGLVPASLFTQIDDAQAQLDERAQKALKAAKAQNERSRNAAGALPGVEAAELQNGALLPAIAIGAALLALLGTGGVLVMRRRRLAAVGAAGGGAAASASTSASTSASAATPDPRNE